MNTLLDETVQLGIQRAIEVGFKRVSFRRFKDFEGELVEVVNDAGKTRGSNYVYFGKGAHRAKDFYIIPNDKVIRLC